MRRRRSNELAYPCHSLWEVVENQSSSKGFLLGYIQPISSPMMKRMFGFCCCAGACELAATTATDPASRLSQSFRLTFMTASFDFEAWLIVAEPLSNDAAKSQMACGCIDILRMTRRRAVPAAVVGRAQMRAALDDLAGNFCSRLTRIVAFFLSPAARVLRNAARFWSVSLVLGRGPISGPFPDIADHVVEAVAIWRKGRDR